MYLSDLWPTHEQLDQVLTTATRPEMFVEAYRAVFDGDRRWKALDTPPGDRFDWKPTSTYVRQPPYLAGMTSAAPALESAIVGARVMAHLGDSVTTDHISPVGAISPQTPAGRWLMEHDVTPPPDFNSYGPRRDNHEVVIRGTFANGRIRNRLAGREGGFTIHLPDGEEM